MRSFSIEQWCERHGFSRSFFYKLEGQGKAPATFKVGRIRRISEAENAAWMAARQAASTTSGN
jgi:predicted DNA-binding transcriptional regulator AlpA